MANTYDDFKSSKGWKVTSSDSSLTLSANDILKFEGTESAGKVTREFGGVVKDWGLSCTFASPDTVNGTHRPSGNAFTVTLASGTLSGTVITPAAPAALRSGGGDPDVGGNWQAQEGG
ncbi:MAG: hypothetical protein ACJ76J_20840 [Thermoanaerobaculia bacterium]